MKKNKNVFILIGMIIVNVFILKLAVNFIKNKVENNSSSKMEYSSEQNKEKSDNKIKNLLSDFLDENEKSRVNETDLDEINFLKDSSKFIPANYPIKQDFQISKNKSSDHDGVDFASSEGTEILSPAFGVVTEIGIDKYFGNYLKINHLNGYQTFYGHLKTITVSEKYFVSRSEKIGEVGNSGFSKFPHLHYEISMAGEKIDPLKLINNIE